MSPTPVGPLNQCSFSLKLQLLTWFLNTYRVIYLLVAASPSQKKIVPMLLTVALIADAACLFSDYH